MRAMGETVTREAQGNAVALRDLLKGALRARGVRTWKYSSDADDANDPKRQRVE